jgi:hypothetical protein
MGLELAMARPLGVLTNRHLRICYHIDVPLCEHHSPLTEEQPPEALPICGTTSAKRAAHVAFGRLV